MVTLVVVVAEMFQMKTSPCASSDRLLVALVVVVVVALVDVVVVVVVVDCRVSGRARINAAIPASSTMIVIDLQTHQQGRRLSNLRETTIER